MRRTRVQRYTSAEGHVCRGKRGFKLCGGNVCRGTRVQRGGKGEREWHLLLEHRRDLGVPREVQSGPSVLHPTRARRVSRARSARMGSPRRRGRRREGSQEVRKVRIACEIACEGGDGGSQVVRKVACEMEERWKEV